MTLNTNPDKIFSTKQNHIHNMLRSKKKKLSKENYLSMLGTERERAEKNEVDGDVKRKLKRKASNLEISIPRESL